MSALIFVATPAHASPPAPAAPAERARERVLIRVVPENKRIIARLRAELDIIGLDAQPLELPADAPLLGPDLLDELGPTGASAALELDISDSRIDVWVADGTTGKTLTRRFDLALDPEQSKPRTLAIAAVELLHASRLEFAPDTTSPPELPAEPTIQQDEDERPPTQFELGTTGSLSLAPMFGVSPGGLGLTGHLELSSRWAAREAFSLRFALRLPVLGNGVSNELGSARTFVFMLTVEPQWTPQVPRAPWFHPALGLGLGAGVVGVIGESITDGITQRNPVLAGFAADAHVDLAFAIHPRIWLHAGGHVTVLQPAPRIFFLDSAVAEFGLPWAVGSIGIELWI